MENTLTDIDNITKNDGREKHLGDLSLLDGLEELLLKDMTTNNNIKWGTDNYMSIDSSYTPMAEVKVEDFEKVTVLPRVMKSLSEQLTRTKDKGEVFTPSWVCAIQNNMIDEAWFCHSDPFCNISGFKVEVKHEIIKFTEQKSWQEYVKDVRLEITCGEAPYLFTRYDVVTGELIPVEDRIGLLDRKLRVVSENCDSEDSWCKWGRKALESVYCYDFQGDNVYLARVNMLMDYAEHMAFKWGHTPNKETLRELCNIAIWNIWQMDGINNTVPFSEKNIVSVQEDFFGECVQEVIEKKSLYCRIFDWTENRSIEFRSLMY